MLRKRLRKKYGKINIDLFHNNQEGAKTKTPVSSDLNDNIEVLQSIFKNCTDIKFIDLKLNTFPQIRAALVYAESLCDSHLLSNFLLQPLLNKSTDVAIKFKFLNNLSQCIIENLLLKGKASTTSEISELTNLILEGCLALIVDRSNEAILLNIQGMEKRAIDQSKLEPDLIGASDDFIESLSTNISLLRRRIRTSNFKVETQIIGKISKTKVTVCYIDGIANENVLKEVKERLQKINADKIMHINNILEFITDEPFSIFPLLQKTQRCDRTAASLYEGRIVIMADNCSSVLIAPCTFMILLQATGDYYVNTLLACFLRLLRIASFMLSLLLPAFTVAIFCFDQAVIPSTLLTSVAGARQNLPFPIVIEILFMEFSYELLREAGLRMPQTIGQSISVVGGLVIGQSVVMAGLASPISGIVVALTALSSFLIPNFSMQLSVRLLRFIFILVAASIGNIGIMLGLILLFTKLSSMRSFGVPYLTPIAPLIVKDLKDTIVRFPLWAMDERPSFFANKNKRRQAANQAPKKPNIKNKYE